MKRFSALIFASIYYIWKFHSCFGAMRWFGLTWLDFGNAMGMQRNAMGMQRGCWMLNVECFTKLKKAPNNNEQTLSKHEQDEHEQEETETCTQM